MTAAEIINLLGLEPHPEEGGYYVETLRSADSIPATALPSRYGSDRSFGTAIYYLLTPDTCSHLHRLQSDEVFHFYSGDPVEMLQLAPDGAGGVIRLGSSLAQGESPQVVVPRGVWQGASLVPGGQYALLGCTVAPGFDFADYESGDQEKLLSGYPAFDHLIRKLTPGPAPRAAQAPR